ncbi:hypothetical protein [Sulfitobacter litoralis]|uniref:hypothetical protein n=1 Tax=Sulfitobacter litoralis TaxID=335975 RepID=UPI002B264EB0|nr:hypothetical protein [Sulfitobacter litoralis]
MSFDANSATIRLLDLEELCVANKRSLVRWFQPRPLHVVSGAPKGVLYPLPEVVARIRQRSRIGLSGDVLNKVVNFDSAVRAERGTDDIYLGDDAEKRAAEFVCCLTPEESERARAVQREIRAAALQSGLPGFEHLRQIVLIHPAAVKYVLSNSADELPIAGGGGWRSFTNALWAVNPKYNNQNQ